MKQSNLDELLKFVREENSSVTLEQRVLIVRDAREFVSFLIVHDRKSVEQREEYKQWEYILELFPPNALLELCHFENKQARWEVQGERQIDRRSIPRH